MAGGLAVSRISFQASRRSRSGMVGDGGDGGAVHRGPRGWKTCVAQCITFPRADGRCEDAPMPAVPPIRTPRFELVSMSLPFMQALARARPRGRRAEIGATVPADMPDDLEHFLEFRIADLSRRPDRPAVARPGDRPRRRDGPRRVIGSVGFHARPTTTVGSRSATASSPSTGGRASRPRSSGRCSTGRGASTASRASAPRPRPTTSPRRRSSPGSASVQVGVQMDESTARSSSSSSTTGRRPADHRRLTAARMPSSRACRASTTTTTDPSFDTLAVHAGAEPDELTGAVAPPIYQTSTYEQDGVGKPRRGYEYARSQNPTRERLERAIAALEGGRHGFAFASGSAATAAIAELADPGEEIVVGDDVYGGTYRYLEQGPPARRRRDADLHRPDERAWTRCGRRCRSGRGSSGSRRRPTRCSRPSTSPRSPGPSTAAARRAAGGR